MVYAKVQQAVNDSDGQNTFKKYFESKKGKR